MTCSPSPPPRRRPERTSARAGNTSTCRPCRAECSGRRSRKPTSYPGGVTDDRPTGGDRRVRGARVAGPVRPATPPCPESAAAAPARCGPGGVMGNLVAVVVAELAAVGALRWVWLRRPAAAYEPRHAPGRAEEPWGRTNDLDRWESTELVGSNTLARVRACVPAPGAPVPL